VFGPATASVELSPDEVRRFASQYARLLEAIHASGVPALRAREAALALLFAARSDAASDTRTGTGSWGRSARSSG
jgi:hypothetical protein